MAQLIVRKIGDDLKERLRARAARKSRSLEAEVRAILTEAVEAETQREVGASFGRRMAELFRDTGFTKEEAAAFDREIEHKRRATSFGE